jgi:peptide/nickel transport system permease protein
MPGSPMDAFLADPHVTQAELERRKIQLGLDKPVLVQYYHWLRSFLNGNLGFSFASKKPVADLLVQHIGPTLLLSFSSFVIALAVSIPLGILGAMRPNSKLDTIPSGISLCIVSTPGFFLAIILIYFFAVVFKVLPSSGMYDSIGSKTFGVLLKHMVLPVSVLSLQLIGSWMRHMRSSMLSVLNEDYIRSAKSRGLNERKVISRHAIKNSLIPVVTMVGLSISSLVSGAIIAESIFSWPGMGTLLIKAVSGRDYPVIMGVMVVVTSVVLLSNLMVDLVYGLLDPRIRYH